MLPTVCGEVVAINVSEADYMAHYAAGFCEWVQGVVIHLAPISITHNNIQSYLAALLDTYFELNPLGRIAQTPFVMHLPTISRREPNLQIIL
jgi:Uma2 family endonuclease